MVRVDVPYIRSRRNRDGTLRWYWIRPGFELVTLPDDEDDRLIRAMELNRDADRGVRRKRKVLSPEENPACLAFWVEEYRKSEGFAALAASSRKNYGFSLDRLKAVLGEAAIDGVSALVIRRYLKAHKPTLPLKIRARAVIRNVMDIAIDGGAIASNPCRDVRLGTPPARHAIYTEDDVQANLKAIDREPEERRRWLRMGFLLELYTGQRVSDCLAMTWARYDGEYLAVAQAKTGKPLEIYCHRVLRETLEGEKSRRKGLTIVQRPNGRPVTYQTFATNMKRIRKSAGLEHLINHDLRRTAATRLAEAQNSIPVIAAVTGHSERYIETLCTVYIQKTRRMTKAAIVKLEAFENGNADVNDSGNAAPKVLIGNQPSLKKD
jgi:integrase